jgi:glycosyltransferase involved in cell wall biosynthesis
LVINDGSTDDSQKIIDDFQSKFPQKIKAFSKENGGLSDARNFGIDRATGNFSLL